MLSAPLDELNAHQRQSFDREVAFMKWARHPNLLTFYGCGWDSHGRAYLVTEFMPHGSLRQVLASDEPAIAEWFPRIRIVSDIAAGMA